MGRGFTSGGQESGSVFSAAVCKIQASKCYIESLSLVLKEAASHKVRGSLYSYLLIARLPSGCRMLNWHLETIYTTLGPAQYSLPHDLSPNKSTL